MKLFGRQSALAAPLTREERDERDRKAAVAEARAIAAHERAVADDLKAHVRAAAEADTTPAPVEGVRVALLAALDAATAHGAANLRTQLDELALGYETDLLTLEYQRQTDALRRALGNFRPTPPLTAKDCDGLAAALRAEVNTMVAALLRRAEEDRAIAVARANKWLSEWARQARRIPTDEKLADARDNAAIDAIAAAREQPSESPVAIEPVWEVEEGAHTRLYRLTYPVPHEGDY